MTLKILISQFLAIKDGPSFFVTQVTYLINKCVKTNVPPKKLKFADILPFCSKEDSLNARNRGHNFVTKAFYTYLEKIYMLKYLYI